jgi:hypothetical protein
MPTFSRFCGNTRAYCSGMPAFRKASIFRSDAAQDGTAAQARNSAIVLTFGPGRTL